MPTIELTPRQTEVAKLLVAGLTDKEIARALRISRHTVLHHTSTISEKLGATGRVQTAISLLYHLGLATPCQQ